MSNDNGIIVTAPILDPAIGLLCARDAEYDPHITLGIIKGPVTLNSAAMDCDLFAKYTETSIALSSTYGKILTGKASGAGIFTPSDNSDGKYVTYITPSVVGLAELRSMIWPSVWGRQADFGWTPHITASYQPDLPSAAEATRFLIAVFTLVPVPVTIDRIVISDFSSDKEKRLGHKHTIMLNPA